MKLYEIANDYIALLQSIEDGELPEEAISDTLEGITGEINEKADNIACVLKSLKAEMDAIKTEVDRLNERKAIKSRAFDRIKSYLSETLLRTGIDKVETARNVITFRKSESVEIDGEAFLLWASQNRDDLLTFKDPEPNKTEIKKALKSGEEIVGAQIVSKQNMQIK
jgi:hypothetical protein